LAASKEQLLECHHEERNPFDRYAIKVYEIGNETPVGHLPREISRVTKFFMDRGATIEVQLTSEHYRRSPIVQGGMEIACKVTVKIIGTCLNLLLLEKYKSLVQELYLEPKEEEVLGNYLQPMHQVIDLPENPTTNKKKRKLDNSKTKDIRSFRYCYKSFDCDVKKYYPSKPSVDVRKKKTRYRHYCLSNI